MKAKQKRSWIAILASLFAVFFALTGATALLGNRLSASAEATGKIFYYVDAGNLVANADGTGANTDRGATGHPNKVETKFMQTYGLTFGTANGGLYNSATDKVFGEDEATGKSWGFTEYEYWESWRYGRTSSSEMGYDSYRQISESGNEGTLTYQFEVDDTTTDLTVKFGTRTPSGWGEKPYNFRINGGEEVEITAKEQDEEHTYTAKGVESNGKNYVTLEFGTDGRNAFVNWIMVTTSDYVLTEPQVTYTVSQFAVKGETSLKAVSSEGEEAEAILDESNQAKINAAEVFGSVTVNATIGDKLYENIPVNVLPNGTEYFVNVGDAGDGSVLLGDGAYSEEKGYGYTDTKGTEGWMGYPYDQSCVYGSNNVPFTYQFDLAEGSYGVIVGTIGHWSMDRAMLVSINGGTEYELNAVADTATNQTYYADIAADGKMQLTVRHNAKDNYIVTFVLVYKVNKVTYDACGGLDVASEYFLLNSTKQITATTEKAGYTFDGWYTAAEGGDKVTEVNATQKVYAHWTAKNYEVTLTDESGTFENLGTVTLTSGQAVANLPTAERTGYTFDGWYTAAIGGEQVKNGDVWASQVTQLFARWTVNEYTVMLDYGNGGTAPEGAEASVTVAYGAAITLPTPVSKENFVFIGWYTASEGGNNVVNGSAWNYTDVTVLYAQYEEQREVVLTLHYNGGTPETPATLTVKGNVAVEGLPVIAKEGYTFDGWFTAETEGKKYANGDTWQEAATVTALYAHFTANVYTVTYVTNGGSAVAEGSYTYGVGLTALATTEREHYVFGGWFADDALMQEVTAISATDLGNKTLYAKWTGESYTVTYVLDGGTGDESATYTYGDGIAQLPVPTRDNYTFDGWFADDALTQDVTVISATDSGDKTLYAKWTANVYTVTYVLDGGTGDESATYTYGVGIAQLPVPTRANYTFDGWFADDALTQEVTAISATDSGDKTFYARWTAVTYTVTVNTLGGNAIGNITVAYGEKAQAPADPTREGYTFAGWYADEGCNLPFSFADTEITGDITVYAGWTEKPADGGNTQETGCGAAMTAPVTALACITLAAAAIVFIRRKNEE